MQQHWDIHQTWLSELLAWCPVPSAQCNRVYTLRQALLASISPICFKSLGMATNRSSLRMANLHAHHTVGMIQRDAAAAGACLVRAAQPYYACSSLCYGSFDSVVLMNAMFAAEHLGTACQPSCTAWLTYLPGGRNALLLLASMPCNCALLSRCIAPIPAASDKAVLERTDFAPAAADVAVSLRWRWAS